MGSDAFLSHCPARWTVVALLLLGFALRMHDLTGTPPGIDGDEAFYYLDATYLLLGHFKIYFPTNFGHEPMFIYLLALAVRLFGGHAFTLRYTSVMGGMLTLAAGYALGRRLFNRHVAFVTLALLATLPWPVFSTRLGLRAFTLLMMSVFSLYTLWRALYNHSWRWAIASGICNGLTLYTYPSSRVFPAVGILWLLALVVLDRRQVTANWQRIAGVIGLAALVALPLVIYEIRNPEIVNQRLYTMGGPVQELQRGDFSGLTANIRKTLGMFTIQGDPEPRWDPASRPVFDPFTGALFYVGVAVALWRWRRPAYSLVLIWLLIMLSPVVLTSGAPSFLRAIGAVFPILAFPGIGLDWLLGWLRRYLPTVDPPVGFAPAILLGALGLGAVTLSVLFGPWRTSSTIMSAYESDLYLAARYLDNTPRPANTNVFVLAQYASDNAQVIFNLQSKQPGAARFTSDFVWPAADAPTWYLFSQESLPDETTRAWLGAPPVYRAADNAGHTVLEIYQLSAPPKPPEPTIPVRAWYDQLADLIGVSYQPATFGRGASGEALLFWRVRHDLRFDPTDPPYIRLRLTSKGLIWSEAGGLLSFPPTQWRTDDVWVQRIPIAIPSDMPPGAIKPEIGISTQRGAWPVIPNDENLARTQFVLPAVEITGQPTASELPPAGAVRFGETLALLDAHTLPQAVPGGPIAIKTTWQALRDVDHDYALEIQLVKSDGVQMTLPSQILWQDVYPTHNWRQGERVTSNDFFLTPPDTQAGEYQASIRVAGADGRPLGDGKWVGVGSVQIFGRPHTFTLPPVEATVNAEFGHVARLIGYRLDLSEAQPGGSIKLTLVWQAAQPSGVPLKVFTHLYDMQNTIQVYAQHDGEPDNGNAPTSLWLPDEYIEDEHMIPLDPSLPSGDYRLGVGMYDPGPLQRLTVPFGGETTNVIILAQIRLPVR